MTANQGHLGDSEFEWVSSSEVPEFSTWTLLGVSVGVLTFFARLRQVL